MNGSEARKPSVMSQRKKAGMAPSLSGRYPAGEWNGRGNAAATSPGDIPVRQRRSRQPRIRFAPQGAHGATALGAVTTVTRPPLGAHTAGSVGPKITVDGAPMRAARCETPLSFPTYPPHSARIAASRSSSRHGRRAAAGIP